MDLAIDLGGSTIDIVIFSPYAEIINQISLESGSIDKNDLLAILMAANIEVGAVQKIVLTGGHNRQFPDKLKGIKIKKVPEIEAIGQGGMYLAGVNEGLVISMGTGTCLVSVKDGQYKHVGGTAVGGGTLVGIGKLILGESQAMKINDLALQGDLTKVDLSVEDIVGEGIGIIPGSATASNFGKIKGASREDLARGICNLVAQTIGTIAHFAAHNEGHKQLILAGKLTRVTTIVDFIKETEHLFGSEIIVPDNVAYVSAIGAMRHQIN